MTCTYIETTTRTASIHTSPARQQFLAVGGGVRRQLSTITPYQVVNGIVPSSIVAQMESWRTLRSKFGSERKRRWWESWR